MLYFSEVKGRIVSTEDGVKVGRLNDLIFLASEQPVVTKIVINSPSDRHLIVPVSYVKRFNGRIVLSKNYQSEELGVNELYIVRNLLDKQIIDIEGSKIVRVNDVVLQDKPYLYISGVDIGLLGILRWLRLERIIFNIFLGLGIKITSKFLSWGDIQPLELARGRVKMRMEDKKLAKIPPEDLADHLEKTNIMNIKRILNLLDEKYAAEVVGNLDSNYQGALFKSLDIKNAAKILPFIDPDEAVDILLTLSHKKREQIISLLPTDVAKRLSYLLKFSATPIGEFITTEYMYVSPKNTAGEVLEMVRKYAHNFSFLTYVYVVNKYNELIGVFSLHELLQQHHDTTVYKFMTQNVTVIHLKTPKEIAIKKMLKYKLFSIPVVDNNKHILGIITIDDIVGDIAERL